MANFPPLSRFTSPRRQGGAVAIMVAVSMVVLLGAVGLVIDGGLAYLVKARLNASVDAAAVAGARAVSIGSNQTEQMASAQAAAANFFAANMPANYMMSRPRLVSTTVSFTASMATIEVRAEAPMAVSLMQVMGFSSLTPKSAAQTIRRDLDMAFVIDTSRSLINSGSVARVRAGAKSFLNQFNVTQDRVGLIHFATGAQVDTPIGTSARGFARATMLNQIDNYVFDGGTASVEGMWVARNELNRIPVINRSNLRVIVFFSDGMPAAMGALLPFKTPSDCTTVGTFATGGTGGANDLMYKLDSAATDDIGGKCVLARATDGYETVSRLPDWYNAHNPTDDPAKREFPIVTGGYRPVTNNFYQESGAYRINLDRAARNLAEAVAAKARDEGIFVFTLGLGDITAKTGDPAETGESVLKCMANVPDGPARCYNPAKPVGMYCYAATDADLTPCFSRLASAILRISK